MFETDRHMIFGDVTLPPEGYQARFSDAINRADIGFIPLVNVEVKPLEPGAGEVERHEFLVLAKAHVRMAYPFEQA